MPMQRDETLGIKLSKFEDKLNSILSEEFNATRQHKVVEFRRTLIKEERLELDKAMVDLMEADVLLAKGDPEIIKLRASALKEMCDLVYAIIGTAEVLSMKFDVAFNLVHRDNMSKLDNPHFRSDGKLEKPDGYKQVNLEDLV